MAKCSESVEGHTNEIWGTWCIPNGKQILVSKKVTFTSIVIDLEVIFLSR